MNRKTVILLAAALALSSCGSDEPPPGWVIGPIAMGENRSVGMPLRPAPIDDGLWSFNFPKQPGHVHYVDRDVAGLADATAIIATVRIEAEPNVLFVSQEYPSLPANMAITIQRAGDDWRGHDETIFYRAYSRQRIRLESGVHVLRFDLTPEQMLPVGPVPSNQFDAPYIPGLLANAARVGVTFGTDAGAGHGVYATGNASFSLIRMVVEYADGTKTELARVPTEERVA